MSKASRYRFRAWDGKRMIDNVAVIGGVAMVETNPPGVSYCIIGPDGVSYYSDWATFKPIDRATLEQSTGLTDSAGVEIFEGDRVKLCYGIPPTLAHMTIVPIPGGLGIECEDAFPRKCPFSDVVDQADMMTVIGHVHEERP